MSDNNNFSLLDNAAIVKMLKTLKTHFKDGPKEFAEPLIDHVCTLVNRHLEACRAIGIDPAIDRTVIEAVEDYQLKQTTGFSVLDRAPEGAEFPVRRLLQYLPPRRSES